MISVPCHHNTQHCTQREQSNNMQCYKHGCRLTHTQGNRQGYCALHSHCSDLLSFSSTPCTCNMETMTYKYTAQKKVHDYIIVSPLARIFRLKGGYMGVRCVCIHISMQDQGGLGACSPRKFRWSEIAFEATLGQKQSHSIVIQSWFTQYCIQFLAVHVCICYSQLTSNFQERRY